MLKMVYQYPTIKNILHLISTSTLRMTVFNKVCVSVCHSATTTPCRHSACTAFLKYFSCLICKLQLSWWQKEKHGCKHKCFCRPASWQSTDAHSKIWYFFTYIDDSQGKPTDTTKSVCKRCFKPAHTPRQPTCPTWQSISPSDTPTCSSNSNSDSFLHVWFM